MKHPTTSGTIIFQIRRCTPDILAVRKQKKKQQQQQQNSEMEKQHQQQQQQQQQQRMASMFSQPILSNNINHDNQVTTNKLPFLVELTYEGFELASPRIIQIKSDFYQVGNDKYMASTHPTNYIRIDPSIPGIEKNHCSIKKSNDNLQVLVIPNTIPNALANGQQSQQNGQTNAKTYVNDKLIDGPTQMFNGFTLRLGNYCLFRLENPNETGLINGITNQVAFSTPIIFLIQILLSENDSSA
jgi:hypothetical protein